MNKVTVKRISFGFPVNTTREIPYEDLDTLKKENFKNKNLHVKLVLEKELKKSFNASQIASDIQMSTGAEKVKISFIYNNSSSERSKEVADAQSITDKFKLYAKLNEIKYSDTTLSCLENIQNNITLDNAVPSDSFELEFASVRGAIGIKDGQNIDEININFKEQYSDGIIILVGKNGAGKSTLIENLHPFPQMLTRSGALKDHFCLKDSHRILIYKMSNGDKIKIMMLIDGAAKSVLTKYNVFYQSAGSDEWIAETSIDGGYDSYKKFCESIFGSLQMFMRTSFFANKEIKSIPDLANATKSEKMTLFSILAGTDYLGAISQKSKDFAKEQEKIIEEIKSQLKDFDNIEYRLTEAGNQIVINSQEIDNYQKLIDIDQQELELCNEAQKEYLKLSGSYDIIRKNQQEKIARLGDIEREQTAINNSIAAVNEDLENKDVMEEQLKWYDNAMATKKQLEITKSKLETNKFNLAAKIDYLEAEDRKTSRTISELENEIYKLKIQENSLEKALPKLDGSCPVCGAPLSEHKKEELEKDFNEISERIKTIKSNTESKQTELSELRSKLNDREIKELKKQHDEIKEALKSTINDISDIDNYAADIDVDDIKDILTHSQFKLDNYNQQLEKLISEYQKVQSDLEEIESQLTNIPKDYTDRINVLTRGIQDSQQQIANRKAENKTLEYEIKRLDGYKTQVSDIKNQIKEHQQLLKEYQLLSKSFSNEGIQALELDSAAPEISDITNAILNETYGDRFTISFDTQRDTKDGRKIDDFIIYVFDAETGRKKKLDVLSSGEGIWVKNALYYAFSVIRSRRTGFCFKTRFLDEADGALDTEARAKYLRMIEVAHRMCNATQTILITHSQEIKEIVDQKIEFL